MNPAPLGSYAARAGTYDELAGPAGVRAHWRPLTDHLAANATDISDVRAPYGRDRTRPWQLDALPFMVDPDEWRYLERGLQQRARLLNEIVADLYGEQRLLSQFGLPPALVHAKPHYQ